MSTKREREMADGIRLWTHHKDEALHEAAVTLIEDMDLTYEEVRWLRRKWESLQSDGLTDTDAEMLSEVEQLTHDWEEEMYWKHGQEEEDEDES